MRSSTVTVSMKRSEDLGACAGGGERFKSKVDMRQSKRVKSRAYAYIDGVASQF